MFAFLKYQSRASISTLQLLHSFIWQMALDNEQLQSPLVSAHKREYRRLNSDLEFVKDIFCQMLDLMPTVFIVIDRLDEILPTERLQIFRTMSGILQMKSNMKLLISSRPEDDISKMLSEEAQPIRVHDCNKHDIKAYVNRRASLVSDASFAEPEMAQEISNLMELIAAKSEGNHLSLICAFLVSLFERTKLAFSIAHVFSISILTPSTDCIGMFLYARLVCNSIAMLGDIESIEDAVNDLPDGLKEA